MSGESPEAWRLPTSDASHLRLLRLGDARELHALIEANRELLARWLPWAAAQTFEDTLGFIRRARSQVSANDGFQVAVVRGRDIAGVAGYVGVNWQHRSTSIGYWLGAEYQGHGTMTEAVRALVNHAFDVWELNRVEIRAAAKNRRSRAIPERLGFRQEATMREAELVGGRYLDSVMYAMLRADWRTGG